MRILQVVHLFLPRHRGGVEVYTSRLARELAGRHEVALFYTEHHPGREPYRLERVHYEGMRAFRTVNNKGYASYEETYRNPAMEGLFCEVLDEFAPDAVHLQHLLFHSLGYARIARERGLPVVFTLHEYWLICLRGGQMILPDLTRCPLPRPRDCAGCARRPWGMASGVERTGDRVLRAIRRLSGIDLWPPARSVRIRAARTVRRLAGGGGQPRRRPAAPHGPGDVARVEARWKAVREAARCVDLFLAPSPFLRDTFVRFGIPAERIVLSDYGFDKTPFRRPRRRRPRERPLRFGFVGNLVPIKGVHLAVEAFRGISPQRAELVIHGSDGHRPDYVGSLRRRARGHPIRFAGAFEPDRVAEILSGIDVLVVPSVWYENSPLTIHEGFLAGVPVLTADLGGMRDLVREGEGGLLFRPGDAGDLRRRIEEILARPEWLDEMRRRPVHVKSIEENARELEDLYRRLREARKGGGRRPT